jgi:hypothetical protein
VTRRFPADVAPPGTSPTRQQQPQHLVRLVGGQHRRRLVQDDDLAAQVELLQDLQLLLFAGRQHPDRLVRIQPERHPFHEGGDAPVLALPRPDTGSADPASASLPGRLVVIGTLPGEVAQIAGAAATDLLSVVISG